MDEIKIEKILSKVEEELRRLPDSDTFSFLIAGKPEDFEFRQVQADFFLADGESESRKPDKSDKLSMLDKAGDLDESGEPSDEKEVSGGREDNNVIDGDDINRKQFDLIPNNFLPKEMLLVVSVIGISIENRSLRCEVLQKNGHAIHRVVTLFIGVENLLAKQVCGLLQGAMTIMAGPIPEKNTQSKSKINLISIDSFEGDLDMAFSEIKEYLGVD